MTYATFATVGSIAVGVIYGFNGNYDASFMFMTITNIWAAADFIKRGK